jgi:hypothetical protein
MRHSAHQATVHKIATGLLFAWLAGWGLQPTLARAAATNSPPVPDARFITQRNIFNPNRYAVTLDGRPQFNPRTIAQAPGFSLVGTMIYEKGAFAFFDGTEPQYKKVIKASGTIADYQVSEITPKYVTLQTSTNHVTLPVGMQMKRLGGEWALVAGTDSSSGSSNGGSGSSDRGSGNRRFGRRSADQNAGSGSAAAPTSAPSGGGGNASDILQKLMQQREKELQK